MRGTTKYGKVRHVVRNVILNNDAFFLVAIMAVGLVSVGGPYYMAH